MNFDRNLWGLSTTLLWTSAIGAGLVAGCGAGGAVGTGGVGPTPAPQLGSSIVFTSDRDHRTGTVAVGPMDVYLMNPDGSNVRRLTTDGKSLEPVLTPRRDKIVFVSSRDGNNELYVMNSDGTAPTRLTNDPAEDRQPAMSPDGRQIVFSSTRTGGGLWITNIDGSGLHGLTSNAQNQLDTNCVWSSRDRIAFERDYLGVVQGHSQAALVAPHYATAPSVSSDVFIIDPSQGNLTQLPKVQGASSASPSWTPDGLHLIIYRYVTRGPDYGRTSFQSDGSNPQPFCPSLLSGKLRFSPDGSMFSLNQSSNLLIGNTSECAGTRTVGDDSGAYLFDQDWR